MLNLLRSRSPFNLHSIKMIMRPLTVYPLRTTHIVFQARSIPIYRQQAIGQIEQLNPALLSPDQRGLPHGPESCSNSRQPSFRQRLCARFHAPEACSITPRNLTLSDDLSWLVNARLRALRPISSFRLLLAITSRAEEMLASLRS